MSGGSVALADTEVAIMRATVETGFDKTAIVRRYTADGEDDYGNQVATWVAQPPIACQLVHTTGRMVTGGGSGGQELTADRNTQISDWFARLPTGTVITGLDRLEVDGFTYEVIGPPSDELTHVRVQLMYVAG